MMNIFVAALLCEALLESGKTIVKDGKIDYTRITTIALSRGICRAYNLDIFKTVGLETPWAFIGPGLSGVLISRGANFVHDLYKSLEGVKINIKGGNV